MLSYFNVGLGMQVDPHVEDEGAFTTPWNAIQRYKRVEPTVADVTDTFNPPVIDIACRPPFWSPSCAENPNSLFGAEGASPISQTENPISERYTPGSIR